MKEKREHIFHNIALLELSEDGEPVYFHSVNCPNYCDYCCNGNYGSVVIDELEA